MNNPSLSEDPGRIDEPQMADEYAAMFSQVAAARRPVIVRRNGQDLAAVVPLEHLELIGEGSTRKRFNELVQEWRSTRGHSSKIKDLVAHSAYQQIIGMGSPAIPLILEELERAPGHWSSALRAITGEDPISPSVRGRLDQEAAAWLQWGRGKNYR